jgi:pimeloyl-ACP methyl ester carboxylesterase
MTGPARVPRAAEWIAENDALVSHRGHRIAFRRRGAGPTVLLLHGFPTWSYDYAEVATDLAADHDVITMDFLGYGASDKPDSYQYSVPSPPTSSKISSRTSTSRRCDWWFTTTAGSSVRNSSTGPIAESFRSRSTT